MARGSISPAAVLRDARSFDKLRSALLRTRLMDGIDKIQVMETLYQAADFSTPLVTE
jgi:hypothetical protein